MEHNYVLVIEYYDQLSEVGRAAWREGTAEEFPPEFWAELDRIDQGRKALCLS